MTLRHVWIVTTIVMHTDGHEERHIGGVYPSADVAEQWCYRHGSSHGPFKAFRYADGDVYLYDRDDRRRYTIQPHPVTYQPPMEQPA